jgi:hypothetical protein
MTIMQQKTIVPINQNENTAYHPLPNRRQSAPHGFRDGKPTDIILLQPRKRVDASPDDVDVINVYLAILANVRLPEELHARLNQAREIQHEEHEAEQHAHARGQRVLGRENEEQEHEEEGQGADGDAEGEQPWTALARTTALG